MWRRAERLQPRSTNSQPPPRQVIEFIQDQQSYLTHSQPQMHEQARPRSSLIQIIWIPLILELNKYFVVVCRRRTFTAIHNWYHTQLKHKYCSVSTGKRSLGRKERWEGKFQDPLPPEEKSNGPHDLAFNHQLQFHLRPLPAFILTLSDTKLPKFPHQYRESLLCSDSACQALMSDCLGSTHHHLLGYMILGKSFDLCLHMQNDDNDSVYLIGLWDSNGLVRVHCLEQCLVYAVCTQLMLTSSSSNSSHILRPIHLSRMFFPFLFNWIISSIPVRLLLSPPRRLSWP